jgi:lipopolysaccharide/colanic/teichoic acid biosynthesis glycosyltransferase
MHSDDPTYSSEVEGRLRRELAARLEANTVARFSVRFHVLPLLRSEDAEPAEPDTVVAPRLVAPHHAIYDPMKRTFDFSVSLILLVLLAPLFALLALLVKLKSPGPILYKQVRIGRSMKPFAMLKFRTMHVNVDHKLHQEFVSRFIKAGGQDMGCSQNGVFKIVNDPRITPIGHVLRKTSLDELPQLWNVLRGDMSLVGPRPPLPYEVEQYKPWHTRRVIDAMPGITGLWQVGGRSQTTFDDMVRLDLQYARTRSFWTDIKILAATPGAVFTGKGAC